MNENLLQNNPINNFPLCNLKTKQKCIEKWGWRDRGFVNESFFCRGIQHMWLVNLFHIFYDATSILYFCFSLIALAVILNTSLKMAIHQFNSIHGSGDYRRHQSKNASGIKWVRWKMPKALLQKPPCRYAREIKVLMAWSIS